MALWRYDRDMMEAQRSNEASIDMMEAQRSNEASIDMMEAQRSNEASIDMMEAQRSNEPLKDSGKLKLIMSIVCLYDTCNIISSLSVQHQCRYFFNIHTQTLKLKSLGGVLLVSSQSEAVSTAD